MEVEIGKMDETVLQKHKAWSRIDGHQSFRSGKGDRKTIRQRWKGTRQSEKTCTRLPWWVRSSESAFQRRGHWLDAWFGKTPPSARHLSPCATSAEPVSFSCWSSRAREPVLHGVTTMRSLRLESSLHSPKVEKACTQRWRSSAAKR